MNKQHSSIEEVHIPAPLSLLSFKPGTVLQLKSSTLEAYKQQNGYGDGKLDYILDLEQYRYTEGKTVQNTPYKCWTGYAPRVPLLEFKMPFATEVIKHGEVDVFLSECGIEFASLLSVPFVGYSL